MSKNMPAEINLRLKMIYDMIPFCTVLGDVGTDHGLLPIYSVNKGKCKRAVASDLREGPLVVAEKNISDACLTDRIKTLLCSGLEGYEDLCCDVIVIAGMGGLTVCQILQDWLVICEKKDYFPGNNIFVLQPNTHEHIVRKFLWDNGFIIEDEQAVKDGAHVYLSLRCKFYSSNEKYTEIECYTGKIMKYRLSENDIVYYKELLKKHNNILLGLQKRIESDENTIKRTIVSQKIISELNQILTTGDVKYE